MPRPLVTIVTPCYNPGRRLLRCLESVADQTYDRIEHLVVDAASSDGTVDVLKASDVRWVSEPDDGQSDAINKGVRAATGSIVTWLNADDVLLPHAVAAAVDVLTTTDAGWVYGDVRVVGDGPPRTMRPPPRLSARDFRVTNPLPQPGTFITADAWAEAGPLDQSLHYSMDVDLWLRLLRLGHVGVHSGAVHAVFEVHDESKGGSVPFAEFALETGLACLRNGHADLGAAYVGRAAAHRAFDRGSRDPTAVVAQLDSVTGDPRVLPFSRAAALASARAQFALLTARRGHVVSAVRALRPDVWRDPLARALMTNAVVRNRWRTR